MFNNLYLVEKLDSAHRADLLREAAHDSQTADLHRSTKLGRRAASKLGALLVQAGSWLERSAQPSESIAIDA